MLSKPELISFELCPYVQRSVITLKRMNVDFDITYIDLESPPDWFSAISPLGKVPVLKHRGSILFESAVINEYLDEVNSGSLLPGDPLEKAKSRAWIEFASALTSNMYTMAIAGSKTDYLSSKRSLQDRLTHVERQIPGGCFFEGGRFSLVDSTYAPLFLRLSIMHSTFDQRYLEEFPKLKEWSAHLCSLDIVLQSVPDFFIEKWLGHLKQKGAYLTG